MKLKKKYKSDADLKFEEDSLVDELGYCPTSLLSDWEWELQLKRLKLSNQEEENKLKYKGE